MDKDLEIIDLESIEQQILFIRGQKVMLDRDLAGLYGVETKVLNQAVKRNKKRFPPDFMFQLSKEEKYELVTNCDRFQKLKYSTALPWGFTEQGVAMLSSVLNSERAIEVNVSIMRAFVRLRQMLSANKDLERRFDALEERYDEQFKVVFDAIRALMEPPEKPRKKIGFEVKEGKAAYRKNKGTRKTAGR